MWLCKTIQSNIFLKWCCILKCCKKNQQFFIPVLLSATYFFSSKSQKHFCKVEKTYFFIFFSKFSYISIYFRLENSNRLTYTDQGSNSRNLSNSHKAAASSGATSTAPSSAGMPQRMSPFDELMAQHQQQIIRERQLLRIASAREARIGGGQTSSQGGGGTSSHVGGHSSES